MDNTRELFRGIYDFEIRDRFCLYESGFWVETIERWRKEGLPEDIPEAPFFGTVEQGTDVNQYMNVLRPCFLPINAHPIPTKAEMVEEKLSEGIRLMRDDWGTLLRCPVKQASLPQYLDWPVKSLEDWEKYRESFEGPAEERIPRDWDQAAERIRNQNNGIVAPHIIGLFAFPREIMGVENLMMYFYDAPELIEKVLDDRLDFIFRVYEKPIRETQPDMAFIWEDMSYKSGPLISPAMCEQYLLPRYKKLTGFFRDLGIKRVVADSDGNVSKLIPIWREGGINGMMPFEVKAGNDVAELAKQWPDMVFFGGIAKMEIAKGNGAIDRELGKRLPRLFGRGGYIAGLDHWVPPEISYEDYRYFRDRVLRYRNGDKS